MNERLQIMQKSARTDRLDMTLKVLTGPTKAVHGLLYSLIFDSMQ